MLCEELKKRQIPPVPMNNGAPDRERIIDTLCREEYGFLPPAAPVTARVLAEKADFCAGKATLRKVELSCALPTGSFAFPVSLVVPNAPGPHPAFVHVNFRPEVPDAYMPTEEIVDGGFAVCSFCYNDVTQDADDGFQSGLAGQLKAAGVLRCGKIGLWAWAVMRVMDYLQTRSELDPHRIAVIGHSRLGKTALLAGALDERFALVISNDSGCSGAALSRGKNGERIADICRVFPYWFAPEYAQYAGREAELPFDQHWLLALAAPRRLYVASARGDDWADPQSEYLGLLAAGSCFGETLPEVFPDVDRPVFGEKLGYHVRSGLHYLSRYDWQQYMAFLKKA
ncbi:MAG: hypothetical protein PHD32_08095 [Eubacteriales bacterium]|nr:hypothetical protein [Eubacteriales bacterium]